MKSVKVTVPEGVPDDPLTVTDAPEVKQPAVGVNVTVGGNVEIVNDSAVPEVIDEYVALPL